jgi:hypothetical protein
VIAFQTDDDFAATRVKNLPFHHAFIHNSVDTQEILDLDLTVGICDEVFTAGADATRGTSIHNERGCCRTDGLVN